MEQKKKWQWIEPIAVIFFLAAAIVLRVLYINMHFDLLSVGNQFLGEIMLKAGSTIQYTIHGCEFLYARLLEILFSLLGNKPIISVYFQVILQSCAILLLYFAVRKMFGKAAALFSFLCMTMIPYVTSAATEQFLLVSFSLYFFLAGILWSELQKESNDKISKVFLTMLAAIAISTFAYLDVIGILFAVLVMFAVLLVSKKNKMLTMFSYFTGTAAGYIAMISISSWMQGGLLPEKIEAYGDTYFGNVHYDIGFITNMTQIDISILGLSMVLLVLLLLWIIGIIKGNTKIGIVLSVFLIGIAGMKVFTIGTGDYTPLFIVGLIVLTGNGIQALIPKRKEDVIPEIMEKDREEMKQESVQESLVTEKPAIRYIENPLPVPKKHVKREMNYGFEPEKGRMKFDIEEVDGDFDIL